MKKRLSIAACPSYEPALVRDAVARHFELAGGIGSLIKRGDKVLIKPNLIAPRPAEQASLTHPAVIVETARLLADFGARVTVGDSPAWSTAEHCIDVLGATEHLKSIGARVCTLSNPVKTRVPCADTRVGLSRTALEADAIINLPKLKAHQQMVLTAAFKNMYGAICGKKKAWWHYKRGENQDVFAELVLGVYQRLTPVYTIIDAVTVMEGKGPLSGRPRETGFIVAGRSAAGCELLCAELLGYAKDELPMLRAWEKFAGPAELNDFELCGDELEPLRVSGFGRSEIVPVSFSLPRIFRSIIKQMIMTSKKQ
ncbi:MAG: DUF362 domain-containing protein [Phycisphaerae bacterium]